jgi:hypothetical protein
MCTSILLVRAYTLRAPSALGTKSQDYLKGSLFDESDDVDGSTTSEAIKVEEGTVQRLAGEAESPKKEQQGSPDGAASAGAVSASAVSASAGAMVVDSAGQQELKQGEVVAPSRASDIAETGAVAPEGGNEAVAMPAGSDSIEASQVAKEVATEEKAGVVELDESRSASAEEVLH